MVAVSWTHIVLQHMRVPPSLGKPRAIWTVAASAQSIVQGCCVRGSCAASCLKLNFSICQVWGEHKDKKTVGFG